jgi:hypothetical protein
MRLRPIALAALFLRQAAAAAAAAAAGKNNDDVEIEVDVRRDLHPSTLARALDVFRHAPQHLHLQEEDQQQLAPPSFLRNLQQEEGQGAAAAPSAPSYLFVQMFDRCVFHITDNGSVVLKSRSPHGKTVKFSDRPFQYEEAIATPTFFADFPDLFNASNGGMPNAAITLVQDDESKDVVVSTFAKAVVNHREDPDGPTYVYKLEQSDEQASVQSLVDLLGGDDKAIYDHCSVFIDSASVSPCHIFCG